VLRVLGAFLVAALLLPPVALAQPRDHMLDVWDTDRGLPTSSVTSLAQTPEGYLWAGTQNGLLRFDGLRFVTFDPETTPELLHARVEHLFVDPQGTLWINTYDGSIASWRAGVFRHEWKGAGPLRFEAFLAPSRPNETVFVLDTGTVIRRPLPSTDTSWEILRPDAEGSDLVPLFAQDASGSLWIRSADHHIWRLRDGRLEEISTRGLAGTTVNCIVADRAGRIWVGTDAEIAVFEEGRFRTMTPTNGPARLDVTLLHFTRDGSYWVVADGRARKAQGRQWVWTREASAGLTGLFRQTVNALEDRRGGIWFSHYGKGLLHVDANGAARWITVADGLPGNRIRHVLEDREGNIWLAVDRAGLVRLRDARFQTFSTAQGSRMPAAASVAEDSRGAIWIGSIGSGLQRFTAGGLETVPLPRPSAGGFVFSVFPAPDGRLWMSADREDLFYFDGTQVRPAPWNLHGIKTILVDRSGAIWLGTKTGLSRARDGVLKTFGSADGFSRGDVRALAEDPQGAIWIGLGDGTVFRHTDGSFREFKPSDGEHGHAIWSLYADTDGTIWIGTFRGGLLRLRDGRFTRYTTEHGLPSNIICQVLEDGAGQLWMGSYGGIFRVAKATLTTSVSGTIPLVSYGRSDGLPTLECSGNYQPSAWKARNGRLWFATAKGVVSVDPTEPTVDSPLPAAVVEEVKAGARRLEFRYTGLSLSTPEQVRFRYRLDGLEHEWVDAGSQRSAHYSYLPPGEYRFLVSASLGDGRWSAPALSNSFTVPPHYSETWPFQLALGIGAIGIVAGAVRYATAKRLQRKLERLELQQAVERDRGRIARDIHDDLGAGLTQITLLSELARREPPQEMETHLGQISDTARELTRTVDEIVWAVNPRQDTLDGLVTYSCQFAQEYLTMAGIQCRLDVPDHLPAVRLNADVRHNLFLAVKEALTNVVKHAGAREVWLRLRQDHDSLTLVIEDDGCGFDAHPGDVGSAAKATSGQGLENLASRLATIGGRCSISSAPGRGTTVELSWIQS
jgi:ligand-binding sensor domain-containing protein/signal transduction histidine kinase